MRRALGGPWYCGRVQHLNRYSVSLDTSLKDYVASTAQFKRVVGVFISRGEAEHAVATLNDLEDKYIAERDALKPKFESWIDLALNPFKGER